MTIEMVPLCETFGVEIQGLDIENISEEDKDDLRQAFLEKGIMLVRDLPLTLQQHVDFSKIFGNLELHPIESIRHSDAPEIIILAKPAVEKDEPNAEEIGGQLPWHTDLIYTAAPSRGAVLTPVVIPPEGGQTGWVDTAKVYEALSDEMKRRIAGLQIVHSHMTAKEKQRWPTEKSWPSGKKQPPRAISNYDETHEFPDVVHPLVYKHVGTDEPVLNVSPMFARNIVGIPEEESDRLIAELQDFATQKRFIYMHDWKLGDVMVWNNWRTMHRAFGCKNKYQRTMYRTTIEGSALPLAMAA